MKGKAPESAHYIVFHCNIGVTKNLFHTSFASWKDAWLLDIGATYHMTFQKYIFEDLSDNVDEAVCFADKSNLKPSTLVTNRIKLYGLPDFPLHDVSYLPELQRNLMSLVHIRQEGHSIHMFDEKIEIRKALANMIVMIGIEEERLLKLQGTSVRAKNFSCLS